MQIRKTYREINPTILFDEAKELVLRQKITLEQNKLETYSNPSDSSNFMYRGTLTFSIQGREGLRIHIIGVDKGETKLMLDSDDSLFSPERVTALEKDLHFLLGAFELKPG